MAADGFTGLLCAFQKKNSSRTEGIIGETTPDSCMFRKMSMWCCSSLAHLKAIDKLRLPSSKINVYMGVSKNRGGPPKWMVCNGKPYQNGWFGGETHYFWKHPYNLWWSLMFTLFQWTQAWLVVPYHCVQTSNQLELILKKHLTANPPS